MSSSDLAISVRGLSKSYTILHNAEKHSTLAEALVARAKNPFQRQESETFWALQDVSFDIRQGEVVGIIGRNGAGKSTLLKVLSRITHPTAGQVDLYGRVGSLLEVGTGFHPELTGRENIFLNGAILGMRRYEISRHFDAIVDFAGVERFLDTPVKRYSSGMYVRLAFAVAAHLEPEILVVDEVLAVGDAEFQQKCMGKIKDVASGGRTVLFVSHNMAAVENLCTAGIVLRNGSIAFNGGIAEAIEAYSSSSAAARGGTAADLRAMRATGAKPVITAARVLNSDGEQTGSFPMRSDIVIEVVFDAGALPPLRNPILGLVIRKANGVTVGGINMRMTGAHVRGGPFHEGRIRCTLKRVPLLQGEHTVDLWLGDGTVDLDNVNGYLGFHVEESDIYGTGVPPFSNLGQIFLDASWKWRRHSLLATDLPTISN